MPDHPPSPGDEHRTSRATGLDRVLEALGHPHRRRILTTIAEANPRDEDEFTPADFSSEDETPEEFLAMLHHVHLPSLADAGFVEWDRDSGTVRRGPRWEDVGPVVELLLEHEDELPAGWL